MFTCNGSVLKITRGKQQISCTWLCHTLCLQPCPSPLAFLLSIRGQLATVIKSYRKSSSDTAIFWRHKALHPSGLRHKGRFSLYPLCCRSPLDTVLDPVNLTLDLEALIIAAYLQGNRTMLNIVLLCRYMARSCLSIHFLSSLQDWSPNCTRILLHRTTKVALPRRDRSLLERLGLETFYYL